MTTIKFLIGICLLIQIFYVVYLEVAQLLTFETYQLPTYNNPIAIMLDYYVGFIRSTLLRRQKSGQIQKPAKYLRIALNLRNY